MIKPLPPTASRRQTIERINLIIDHLNQLTWHASGLGLVQLATVWLPADPAPAEAEAPPPAEGDDGRSSS